MSKNTDAADAAKEAAAAEAAAKKAAKAEAGKCVAMVRSEPMLPGGPVKADVHPDEVENWIAAGWRTKE